MVPLQESTPDMRKADKERRRQQAPLLSHKISAQVSELRKLLATVVALDLLAALSVETFTVDMESYETVFPERPWIYVEFPTWLYLTSHHTTWEGNGTLTRDVIDKVFESEDVLLELVAERRASDYFLKGLDHPSPQDEILGRARSHHLFVRQSVQLPQLWHQQVKIFEEVQEHLRRLLGFTIGEAWGFFKGLMALISRRLADLRRTKVPLIQSLQMLVSECPQSLAEVYKVTPSQLATVSESSEGEARAFLEFFALKPGQIAIGDSSPNIYEPLEVAPLINLGGDIWFVHLLPKLPLAFRPGFERALKTDARAWKIYERARARYLESRSLELISRCSGAAHAWGSLEYDFDEGTGSGTKRFELDGLIAVDTVLFLVEAKSGGLRWAARRGAPSAMDDLGELVSESYRQALRALRFIRSLPSVTFYLKDGRPVTVVGAQFTRVVLLTTTLDDLAAYVTRLSALVGIGILSDAPLPWAVAVHDLEMMTDIVEGIGQLVHYVERRHAAESVDFDADSELDLFAGYLLNGLHLEGAGNARVMIPDLTRGINDYYAYQHGLRRAPALKPCRYMPAPLRKLIQYLEASAPPGFIEAICALCELNPGEQDSFMKFVGARHSSAMKQGFSAFFQIAGSQVIAFASGRNLSRDILTEYTKAAKHVTQRDRAVGIMQVVGNPESIEIVVEIGVWQKDPQMQATSHEVLKRYTI